MLQFTEEEVRPRVAAPALAEQKAPLQFLPFSTMEFSRGWWLCLWEAMTPALQLSTEGGELCSMHFTQAHSLCNWSALLELDHSAFVISPWSPKVIQ